MLSSSFLHRLSTIGCIKFGQFTLKSGMASPVYVDLRNIISYPDMLQELAGLIAEKADHSIQRICGVPYAALPMASVVSVNHQIPMIIKRKEAKAYGTKKTIEGFFQKGDRVLVVEDVITSGMSLLETIKELEAEGLVVAQIITVLDREQGGMALLKEKGYAVTSLYNITELVTSLDQSGELDTEMKESVLAFVRDAQIVKVAPKKYLSKTHPHRIAQRLLDIAHQKKSNIIASVDLTSANDILSFLEKVGPCICAAKLHIDIVSDFSQSFIQQLKALSIQHSFLLIEDRKFADIGNTQLLQLAEGIYRIADWADIVTIHLISGEPALKALQEWDAPKKPALLPVIEMSSAGALTDEGYIARCKDMMKKYPDVIGAVCQQASLDAPLLKCTPGVNIETGGDGKGQQYNTPTHVLQKLRSDFLIVGRGLYKHTDPAEEAMRYLDAVRAEGIFDTEL